MLNIIRHLRALRPHVDEVQVATYTDSRTKNQQIVLALHGGYIGVFGIVFKSPGSGKKFKTIPQAENYARMRGYRVTEKPK